MVNPGINCYDSKTCEQPGGSGVGCDAMNAFASLECCCLKNDFKPAACSSVEHSPKACDAPPAFQCFRRPSCEVDPTCQPNDYDTLQRCCCEEDRYVEKWNRKHIPPGSSPASYKTLPASCSPAQYKPTPGPCEPSPSGLAPADLGTIDPRTCLPTTPGPTNDFSLGACCERFGQLGSADDPRAGTCAQALAPSGPAPAPAPVQPVQPVPAPMTRRPTPAPSRPGQPPLGPSPAQASSRPMPNPEPAPGRPVQPPLGPHPAPAQSGAGGLPRPAAPRPQTRPVSRPARPAVQRPPSPQRSPRAFGGPGGDHRSQRFAEKYFRD